MNKLIIIGNLTRDPVSAVTQGSNIPQCRFTVAVTRRGQTIQNGQPEADFFNVTTWRNTADACARYLRKGSKVCVTGPVAAHTYQGSDGQTRVSMDLNAQEVEFLSSGSGSGSESNDTPPPPAAAAHAPVVTRAPAYTPPQEDDLPF